MRILYFVGVAVVAALVARYVYLNSEDIDPNDSKKLKKRKDFKKPTK